jgi:hypothetical protein
MLLKPLLNNTGNIHGKYLPIFHVYGVMLIKPMILDITRLKLSIFIKSTQGLNNIKITKGFTGERNNRE